MAKTIVTQFGEFLNYANIVKIGVETNWDDAEIDEENGTIKPDFEMIGTDTAGNKIPMVSMTRPMKQIMHSKPFMTGFRPRRMPFMRSRAVMRNAVRLRKRC